ncbi:MAG: Prolipoprotein diacylglyceryl transferase [Bacteroidetes bacterium ADurb.Bin302]|nr:MAG: Prolipoprotein diacylglyceryl transferase [Bacteroidetes bacterium ADurb.Bin302]
MNLLSVIWNVDPVAFSVGPITLRWYGIIYATGFLIAIWILSKMFKKEGCPDDWSDKVFIYLVLAVIVGSRLGHVFFYDWAYYSQHPSEIIKIWHGGLASHGGAAAIILAVWLLSKYMTRKPFLWLADRLFVVCSLAASFIRIANLMNSEIYGCVTTLPWGFKFLREFPGLPVNLVPVCHPTQLYESLAYFVLFLFLMWLYWKKGAQKHEGLLTGIGFTFLFTARFFIEFIKNDQSDFEAGMILNMGQLLSIPFILVGIWLIVRVFMKRKKATK